MALSEERKALLEKIAMEEREARIKNSGTGSSKKKRIAPKNEFEDSNQSQSPLAVGQVSCRALSSLEGTPARPPCLSIPVTKFEFFSVIFRRYIQTWRIKFVRHFDFDPCQKS